MIWCLTGKFLIWYEGLKGVNLLSLIMFLFSSHLISNPVVESMCEYGLVIRFLSYHRFLSTTSLALPFPL